METQPGFVRRLNWRLAVFWVCTLAIAYENLDGSFWSFLRIGFVRADLVHLGYPPYFLYILGTGEICIAVALLVPAFPVAKVWAYAGATLNYSAALTSHVVVERALSTFSMQAIFCLLLVATSWLLRPPNRRPRTALKTDDTSLVAWLVPAALLTAFAVIAILTLPYFSMSRFEHNLHPIISL